MLRSDFRFTERLRVRWAEIDAQQIVFNGHYLMYFDTAVAGYWRAMAVPYAASMEKLAGDLYVRKATVEYHASAHYDDVLDVGVRCARIGNSSIVFQGGVFRRDALLVGGELIYVFADPAAKAARPVPPALRELLDAFESGEPMIDVRVGSWAEHERNARALRSSVFIDEQGIPAGLEWDDADRDALHAVAYNRLDMPLATGRLVAHAGAVGKIGRMAVARHARGMGVGRAVLDALIDASRSRGDREALLHAQMSAAAFYEGAGFERRGPAFDEAGIAHVEMARAP